MKELEHQIRSLFKAASAYMVDQRHIGRVEFVLIFPDNSSCRFQLLFKDSPQEVLILLNKWTDRHLVANQWIDKIPGSLCTNIEEELKFDPEKIDDGINMSFWEEWAGEIITLKREDTRWVWKQLQKLKELEERN